MKYAISLDIGTTNIQGLFIDTTKNKQLDYLTLKNSQVIFGTDLITRLGRSLKDPVTRVKIRERLINDLTLLIGGLLKRTGCPPGSQGRIIACGNSAMHHILLGLPLEKLARAPFRPVHKGTIFKTTLGKLGVKDISDNIPFLFLPNLGGFVGSDALCGIVETGMYDSREVMLLIDLGTNGEIIMGSKKRILVASTSAGPAFEGWHIKSGVYGSTIIDVVSGLLRSGIIDRTGFMRKKTYLHKTRSRKVKVTQKDVREFQLAKAAILAGIRLLKKKLGDVSIKKVYITGVFGAKLNKSSVENIRMLPRDIKPHEIHLKEKMALRGIRSLLQHKNIEGDLSRIIKNIDHVELHREPDFQDIFTQSIGF